MRSRLHDFRCWNMWLKCIWIAWSGKFCRRYIELVHVADLIIGSVMSKLQNAGKKYTAVYTAKESSQVGTVAQCWFSQCL